jgi:hypothetical protein
MNRLTVDRCLAAAAHPARRRRCSVWLQGCSPGKAVFTAPAPIFHADPMQPLAGHDGEHARCCRRAAPMTAAHCDRLRSCCPGLATYSRRASDPARGRA